MTDISTDLIQQVNFNISIYVLWVLHVSLLVLQYFGPNNHYTTKETMSKDITVLLITHKFSSPFLHTVYNTPFSFHVVLLWNPLDYLRFLSSYRRTSFMSILFPLLTLHYTTAPHPTSPFFSEGPSTVSYTFVISFTDLKNSLTFKSTQL